MMGSATSSITIVKKSRICPLPPVSVVSITGVAYTHLLHSLVIFAAQHGSKCRQYSKGSLHILTTLPARRHLLCGATCDGAHYLPPSTAVAPNRAKRPGSVEEVPSMLTSITPHRSSIKMYRRPRRPPITIIGSTARVGSMVPWVGSRVDGAMGGIPECNPTSPTQRMRAVQIPPISLSQQGSDPTRLTQSAGFRSHPSHSVRRVQIPPISLNPSGA